MRSLLALLIALASPGLAEPLVFEGRIEASERAVLSSRLNGVVAEIMFEGGDHVLAGQPLIRLDPVDATVALEIAEARLAASQARFDGAARRTDRQKEMHERGIAADSTLGAARTERAMAEAEVALAEAERRRAVLDLERTTIRAAITGLISPPSVSVGAFLEAEAAPPLATIVAFDPAVVAYRAPYDERLESLEATGAKTVDDLLDGVRVQLRLPGDRVYPGEATPHATSAEVDAETGTVTVWARFPNPDALLRPGMVVTVLSDIHRTESMK
ncbi:MAG: efflux RND transporter periplasmic adaptor subunit [Roseovarius sp.]